MSKKPPPAHTACAGGPCPTVIQNSRTPQHWKFTQDHRTTHFSDLNKEVGEEREAKIIAKVVSLANGSPVAQWVKLWPTDLVVLGLIPPPGKIFSVLNRVLLQTAFHHHRSAHPPDLTEILSRRT